MGEGEHHLGATYDRPARAGLRFARAAHPAAGVAGPAEARASARRRRWWRGAALALFTAIAISLSPARAAAEAPRPDAPRPDAPRPDAQQLRVAEKRWRQGAAAASRGDLEQARAAFLEAYEIVAHPNLLAALGGVEVKSGRYVEGARHLSAFLAADQGPSKQRAAAEESLAVAARHVGTLKVDLAARDAAVTVDDEALGPPPVVWYVAPGRHHVVVRRNGRVDGEVTVDLKEGEFKGIAEVARPKPPEAAARSRAGDVPSASGSSASGLSASGLSASGLSASGSSGAVPPASATVVPPDVSASAASAAAPATPSPTSPEGGSSARKIVIVSGAVATAVALGVGIYSWHQWSGDREEHSRLASTLGPSGCVAPTDATREICGSLEQKANRLETEVRVAEGSFILGGLLGASTLALAILWPTSSASSSVAKVAVVPTAQGARLSLAGAF